LDYFIFDGVDSRDYGLYIVNWNNQPLVTNMIPPKITQTLDLNWLHGQKVISQKYYTRDIEVTCYLEDNNLSNIRHISGWLGQLGAKSLVLSYEPYKFYYATFEDQIGLENYNTQGLFTLTFRCYNPFAYSRFTSIDIINGLNYDEEFYYDSGLLHKEDMSSLNIQYQATNITTTTNINVYHGGNTNLAYPKIIIEGNASDITITNTTNNKLCSFGTFSGALIIDCELKNCFTGADVNNVSMNNTTFSGSFFNLNGKVKPSDTGINVIEISGTNLSLTSITFDFNFVYL
jgi:predicted phage tail component-like protein